MYGIHNVTAGEMGQIVKFTNHVLAHELALVVRVIIEAIMKQALGTHSNGLCSGPGTNTDVFDNLLCKHVLREFILSVLLLLYIYSYIVIRLYFFL